MNLLVCEWADSTFKRLLQIGIVLKHIRCIVLHCNCIVDLDTIFDVSRVLKILFTQVPVLLIFKQEEIRYLNFYTYWLHHAI